MSPIQSYLDRLHVRPLQMPLYEWSSEALRSKNTFLVFQRKNVRLMFCLLPLQHCTLLVFFVFFILAFSVVFPFLCLFHSLYFFFLFIPSLGLYSFCIVYCYVLLQTRKTCVRGNCASATALPPNALLNMKTSMTSTTNIEVWCPGFPNCSGWTSSRKTEVPVLSQQ